MYSQQFSSTSTFRRTETDREYLANIHVYSCSFEITLKQTPLIIGGALTPQMRRQSALQDARNSWSNSNIKINDSTILQAWDIPWYARRHQGPAITTTSPDRKSIDSGFTSLVVPPTRRTAALPNLSEGRMYSVYISKVTYETETSGEVAQTSERSTCPIKVS